MIRSMTGFGKGRAKSEYGIVIVEIKTINQKYFELGAKLPPELSLMEYDIRELVQKEIKRGRINFFLDIERSYKKTGHVIINAELAAEYRKKLSHLCHELQIRDDMGVAQILALPRVVELPHIPLSQEKIFPAVQKALIQAIHGVVMTRRREGRLLAQDISRRIVLMQKSLAKIKTRAPHVTEQYGARLWESFKKFQNVTVSDRERLEKDIALFAKNCDISEELCRMQAHLDSFRQTLSKGGEIGKKLDFMAQELHREATTIGSKANDFTISSEVIKMKSEIEKIREQLQNIE